MKIKEREMARTGRLNRSVSQQSLPSREQLGVYKVRERGEVKLVCVTVEREKLTRDQKCVGTHEEAKAS